MSSIEPGEALTAESFSREEARPEPSPVDRLAAHLVRGVLERITGGRVSLSMPDGTVERFGANHGGEDVRVRMKRWRAFRRLLFGGDTGAAEAFMDGDWEADDLPAVVRLFVANAAAFDRDTPFSRASDLVNRARHSLRRNTLSRARRNIEAHYDLGNRFYELFLDRGMTYSCALFEGSGESLETAQERKLRRIASLAGLEPGCRILEIGCGWGSFATLAAKEYGCRVLGLTLSNEQAEYARERADREGVADRIEIRLADYRTLLGERFDRIVSVEMLEAVGHEYLPTFFSACDSVLAEGGVAVVQTITIPEERHARLLRRPDFIQKHIFPGSQLPSLVSIEKALASTRLQIAFRDEIGPHYVETLRRWRASFLAARENARSLGYSETFLRMWEYYLCYCEGGFASGYVGDAQLVLSRNATCRPRNATC